jgi:Uma2 family endonuclease
MLMNALTGAAPDQCDTRVQLPLTLARSEPEPDLAVVDRATPRGRGRHPSTALLVIEVARDTIRKDLGVKAKLYAEAGVTEYWVIDTPKKRVHVHRDPDAAACAYRSIEVMTDGTLTSSALPGARVELRRLFAFERHE